MTPLDALAPIVRHRRDRVVITTMTSVGLWPTLSRHERDFAYLPSSMGQAIPLGIGLALARPGLGVVVLSGDGGLLMNLGCLVTLAEQNVSVCVVLLDNGLYEVTGGQPTVGAGRIDFAGLARSSGIGMVGQFEGIEEWEKQCEKYITHSTPSFAWCKIVGERGKKTPSAPEPMESQIARLRTNLVK